MPRPPSSRAIALRSCVVNAVRESEALMARMVQATMDALSEQEQDPRSSAWRDAAGDARRLLNHYGPALVRNYPMALLEICAEPAARTCPVHAYGSPSGASPNTSFTASTANAGSAEGFGELTLLGEEEVHAQVEMSRAQQQAMHATDAVLAELDALMSAAQGLGHVQPERNPLRPYSYLRALQQVVSDTGVPLSVRERWMQLLCGLLGGELTGIYQQAVKELRAAGIAPVGYGRGCGSAGAGARSSSSAGRQAMESRISQYQATGHSTFMASDYHSEPWNAQAEEAMLTVGVLRQMLAEESDFSAVGGASSLADHPQHERTYRSGNSLASFEDLEDMVILEQLVSHLSQDSALRTLSGAPTSRSHSTFSGTNTADTQGASMYAAPPAAPTRSEEIVARMVETMAEEGHLLVPVQRAVQNLEPAVRQLVRHDARFFSDSQHPARRLLDEITQRSLAFSGVKSPGFSSFMQLVDEAVGYLSSLTITNAQPFDIVLSALQTAWESQAQKRHSAQHSIPATMPLQATSPAVVAPAANHFPEQEAEEAAEAAQARNILKNAGGAVQKEPPPPLSPADTKPDAATADSGAREGSRAAQTFGRSAAAPTFDDVDWVLGVWVEMNSSGRPLRTQLTWVSPQQTLFLFTAADGSTQSMTRRVRDKLTSTGALRLLPANPQETTF